MLLLSKQVPQLNRMSKEALVIVGEVLALAILELLRRNNKNTSLMKKKVLKLDDKVSDSMDEHIQITEENNAIIKDVKAILTKTPKVNSD